MEEAAQDSGSEDSRAQPMPSKFSRLLGPGSINNTLILYT